MRSELEKFIGKYRVIAEYDPVQQDFPRDKHTGRIDESFADLYIPCRCKKGATIYDYSPKIFIGYIPSLKVGNKILEKLQDVIIESTTLDSEIFFSFDKSNINTVASIMRASTQGVSINPFSSKNLPKHKEALHPETYYKNPALIEAYKAITAKVDQKDKLSIHHVTIQFLRSEVLKKTLHENIDYDIYDNFKESGMKELEYIDFLGEKALKAYLKYLEEYLPIKH